MKKAVLLFISVLFLGSLNSQVIFDNFGAYTLGQYLGPQSTHWRTYSPNGEGTIEDVKITDEQYSSFGRSILLEGDFLNNNPQNIVLELPQTYTNGVFVFQSSFFFSSTKSAKFNFQSGSSLGVSKSLDIVMEFGEIFFTSGGRTVLRCSRPTNNSWFDLTINANLTTKVWEVKINGVSEGKWVSENNTISFINFTPTGNDKFFLDEVSVNHLGYAYQGVNATAATLIRGGGEVSTNVANPSLVVVNSGLSPITSFEVQLEYEGQVQNHQFPNVNLPSFNSVEIPLSAITYSSNASFLKAEIISVNGIPDDLLTDNISQLYVDPVVPAEGKMVVTEERTGTWCSICPMGHYHMDKFENDFGPFWVGISVHTGDPMEVDHYNDSFPQYAIPWRRMDRKTYLDGQPNMGMEKHFFQQIVVAPKAVISVGADFDPISRDLDISGTFDFVGYANNGYKAAFVITEDSVVDYSFGYSQSNAYAGGGFGLMGGYENLSSPVPSYIKPFDRVARTIQPSFSGYPGSFPTNVIPGQSHIVNQTITIPYFWNENKLNIIVLLINPDGEIDNAGNAYFQEALDNGSVLGLSFESIDLSEAGNVMKTFKMFPNPATTNVAMTFNLKNESDVALRVIDLTGKVLASRDYAAMNGASEINYNTSDLKPGIYMVEVTINGERLTRQLVIK